MVFTRSGMSRKRSLSPSDETRTSKRGSLSGEGSKGRTSLPAKLDISGGQDVENIQSVTRSCERGSSSNDDPPVCKGKDNLMIPPAKESTDRSTRSLVSDSDCTKTVSPGPEVDVKSSQKIPQVVPEIRVGSEETTSISVSSQETTSESDVFPASTQSSQNNTQDSEDISSQTTSQGLGSQESALAPTASVAGVQETGSENAVAENAHHSRSRGMATGTLEVPQAAVDEMISPPRPRLSSSKSRRKSRRRSSFAVGRKSEVKGPSVLPSSEVCKTIPKDLPEEERLARLHQLLIQRTVQKMEAEAEDDEGFTEFKSEVMENMENWIQRMKREGQFKEACTPGNSLLPNPINIKNEKRVNIYNEAIAKLNKEQDCWDQLLKKREDQAREAKKMYENQPAYVEMERPANLTAAEKKLLDGKLDYRKQILTKLKVNMEFAQMFVEKLEMTVRRTTRYHEKATNCIKKQSENLGGQLFRDVPDPKETISALLKD